MSASKKLKTESSTSSTTMAESLTWSDLASLHCTSTVGCIPSSLSSLVEFIGLEGGKQGCTAMQLRNLVHRHVRADDALESTTALVRRDNGEFEPPLDMRVMELWWTQIRQHRALSFFTIDDSSAPPSSSSPAPPPALVSPSSARPSNKVYAKVSSIKSQLAQTLQMTEDGILFAPFHRQFIPAEQLAGTFDSVTRRYPTLTVVTSGEVRRRVLGWAESSDRVPSLSEAYASGVGSSTGKGGSGGGDDEKEGGKWQSQALYCCVETIGRASYSGLVQTHLLKLLSMTSNNAHVLLFALRMRGLLCSATDRFKHRLWLKHLKQRGDAVQSVREERQCEYDEWYQSMRPRWQKRMQRERERDLNAPSYPTVDDDEALLVPFALHNGTQPPELTLTLSHVEQIYRLIHASATRGVTTADIREALGLQGLKGYERVLASMDKMGVVSAGDRQGKSFSYRFFTRENFDRWRAQQNEPSNAPQLQTLDNGQVKDNAEEDVEAEEKSDVMEIERSVTGALTALTPTRPFDAIHRANEKGRKSSKAAVASPASCEAESSPVLDGESDAAAGDELVDVSKPIVRGVNLQTIRRRRTTVDLLKAASSQLLSANSLLRSLAAMHPPVMTLSTFKAFLNAMQDDGVVQLQTLLFPSGSGRRHHSILVVGLALSRPLSEEEAVGRKEEAYAVAMQQLHEFRALHSATSKSAGDPRKTKKKKGRPMKEEEEGEEAESDEEAGASGDEEQEEEEEADGEEELNDSSSVASEKSSEVRRKSQDVDWSQGGRDLFCWIRPALARAWYLHRALWTTYQQGENPVVRRESPTASLSFKYVDLVQRLLLRDFLLIAGLQTNDPRDVPFLTGPSVPLMDVPFADLPEDIRRVLEEVDGRTFHPVKFLFLTLAELLQLRLIQPAAKTAPVHTRPTHQLGTANLHFEYTLTNTVQLSQATFNFSQPNQLNAYWQMLRRSALGQKDIILQQMSKEWQVDVDVVKRLNLPRRWCARIRLSEGEQAQLVHFVNRVRQEAERGRGSVASVMSMDHVKRAAELTHVSAIAVATFVSRIYFPQLAAVHDEVDAFQLVERADARAKREPGAPIKRRRRRKQADASSGKSEHKVDEAVESVKDEDEEEAKSEGEEEDGAEEAELTERDLTNSEEFKRAMEPPRERPNEAPAKPATRKRRKRVNAPWTSKEDDELVAVYNGWLEEQRNAGALPFSYTPAPHVDLGEDDGLAFTFTVPSNSSQSIFAASLHSLLPLMWLDRVEEPPGPLRVSAPSKSKQALTEEEMHARGEFVLHDIPLPSPTPAPRPSPTSDEVQEDEDETDRRSEPSRDEEQEMAQRKEEDEPVKARRPLHVAASSALLRRLYALAAERIPNRTARQVQHRLDNFRTRLDLPIGVTSSRKKPLLSTPYTVQHLAPHPELMALSSLLKVIFLEPPDSYMSTLSHLAVHHTSEEQVTFVIDVLRADRWICKRKGTFGGTERGWTLTAPAREILFGKKEEKDNAEHWNDLGQDSDLGQQFALHYPLKRSHVDAVADAIARLDLDVRLPTHEDAVEDDDQQKAEAKEEAEAEEKAQAGEEGAVKVRRRRLWPVTDDPIDRQALRVTRVDLAGSSVNLLSTRWPLTHKVDSSAMQIDTEEPQPLLIASQSSGEDEVEAMEDAAGGDDSEDQLQVQLVPDEGEESADDAEELSGEDDDAECVALCGRVVQALVEAEGAGLSVAEVGRAVEEEDSEVLISALQRALRLLHAVRVFSYDHERFVAAEFASRWAFPDARDPATQQREETAWRSRITGHAEEPEQTAVPSTAEDGWSPPPSAVMAHPWRRMGGEVNEELWAGVYGGVLRAVRQWPGIDYGRLLGMFAVLTPMELQHVLDTLLIDDRITRRSWRQPRKPQQRTAAHTSGQQVEEKKDEVEEAAEELVTCYFPITASGL